MIRKKIKIADLPTFDPTAYLANEAAIAAYLSDILEENDPALFAAALGDVARARGMTDITKLAGVTREALYKALRPESASVRHNIAGVQCAWCASRCASPACCLIFRGLYIESARASIRPIRPLKRD